MGAYLNKPVTEKESEIGENGWVRFAASCMQGWRINQEDAHNCILDFAEDCSLFAVYDGHGGSEVARYTAVHLPDLLKNRESWKSGDYKKAIEDAFLELDDILRSDEVLKQLKVMAGTVVEKHQDPIDDEDKQILFEEASMPLESILEKYGFSLRRDRSGKAVIDLENVHAFHEEMKRPLANAENEAEEGVKENGNEEEIAKDNGNAEELVHNSLNEKDVDMENASNGQVGEEKIKKRVCQSPIVENPKRPKSDDLADESEKQKLDVAEESKPVCEMQSSIIEKTEITVVTEESNGHKEAKIAVTEEVKVCETEDEKHVQIEIDSQKTVDTTLSENKEIKKSALQMELEKEDDEGPSIRSDLRQIDDDDDNKPQPSAALEAQTAMSSDSEQSFDEDYKEEDEVSEEDEEDDDSEPDEEAAYNGPSGDTPGEDSGTTACVVLLFKDKVLVGNAGDSRAVLCRKGKAIDLSIDHKPEDTTEKSRIEAAGGEISLDGRVNGGLNLSRALGDHFYKKNNNLPLKDQMISAQPDVTEHSIIPDDEFVVVACDGIWNSLTSQDVVDFVRKRINDGVPLKEICEKMCDECLSPNTAGDGTGCDNMTVTIAELIH